MKELVALLDQRSRSDKDICFKLFEFAVAGVDKFLQHAVYDAVKQQYAVPDSVDIGKVEDGITPQSLLSQLNPEHKENLGSFLKSDFLIQILAYIEAVKLGPLHSDLYKENLSEFEAIRLRAIARFCLYLNQNILESEIADQISLEEKITTRARPYYNDIMYGGTIPYAKLPDSEILTKVDGLVKRGREEKENLLRGTYYLQLAKKMSNTAEEAYKTLDAVRNNTFQQQRAAQQTQQKMAQSKRRARRLKIAGYIAAGILAIAGITLLTLATLSSFGLVHLAWILPALFFKVGSLSAGFALVTAIFIKIEANIDEAGSQANQVEEGRHDAVTTPVLETPVDFSLSSSPVPGPAVAPPARALSSDDDDRDDPELSWLHAKSRACDTPVKAVVGVGIWRRSWDEAGRGRLTADNHDGRHSAPPMLG